MSTPFKHAHDVTGNALTNCSLDRQTTFTVKWWNAPVPVMSDDPPVEAAREETGPLDIKDRRSWSTWQVLAFLVGFGVIGILLGHCGARSHANAVRKSLYTLPAQGSSPATTAAQPTAGDQVTTTTVAAPASAPPAASTGPAVVLVPNTQGSGPRAVGPFNAGGTSTIGWAFRCVLAPGGTGQFQVFLVPESGQPATTPAVDENGRQSQGTASVSTTGRQHLEIRTDPACAWALKVTGPAGSG